MSTRSIKRCAVVGGGIIGVAVARELTTKIPGVQVTVYEKEDRLAGHQTGHNSGVVHAGLYYEPGGLKARLCRRGVELLQEFCATKNLPYEACGKLVIAQTPEESKRLDTIFARATANGVPGARMLRAEQIREVEPNAVGLSALHSPETAIVDYAAITEALADDVRASGGTIRLGQEVTSLEQQGRAWWCQRRTARNTMTWWWRARASNRTAWPRQPASRQRRGSCRFLVSTSFWVTRHVTR
jgi:L-2-hydroxyglutarate oxidase